MNLQELRDKPREWKVIDTTRSFAPKQIEGNILEEYIYHNGNKTVTLCGEDLHTFLLSDLQEMTPLEYNGVRIGIGDEIMWNGKWREVYDYIWYDGKWRISTVYDGDYQNNYLLADYDIEDHKPLHPKQPLEVTLDEVAEKFGVDVKNLKIKK
jgi:hypothetical protein